MGPRLKTFIISIAVILAGVAGFATLKATKPVPPEKEEEKARQIVRVIEVKKEDVPALVEESGTVEPKTTIHLTAEVAGRITYVSENMRIGNFVAQREVLVEIDPREYRLSVVQFQAQIAQLKAEIAKTTQQKANIRRNLAVEEHKLRLSRGELERKKKLFKSGSISQSEIDKQEIDTRLMETSLLNQENALALLKSEADLIRAKIEATQAQLEMAELKLEKTKIFAPVNGRVQEESVEVGQYVPVGQKLGTIYDISAMEVVVYIAPRRMAPLMALAEGKAEFPIFTDIGQANELIKRFGPTATVQFRWRGGKKTWKGRVTRSKGMLDETTRTVPVVVEIKDPFKGVRPGKSPPLIPGMFVDVILEGTVFKDVVKLPRNALHNDSVYVLSDGKLEIRKVKIAMMTRDYAIISKGLQNGDKVIVSPIPVPIPGTELRTASTAD
jgi:RND family efflux transporter MFP subunit